MSEAAAAARAPDPPPLVRLLARYLVFAVLAASILFLISGRLDWLRAWVYIAITLGIQVLVGVVLRRRNPELLAERRRIQPGTKSWDKVLVPVIAFIGPVAIWCVAAWDVRMHWPPVVHAGWSIVALVVCALASLLVFWAMVTNRFFSGTVRIQTERNHVVVEDGPYRYVRHPGYSGALLFTMASPVALGSWYALIPAALTSAILVLRTALEDATLRAELHGYAAYAHRVSARLVPRVW